MKETVMYGFLHILKHSSLNLLNLPLITLFKFIYSSGKINNCTIDTKKSLSIYQMLYKCATIIIIHKK